MHEFFEHYAWQRHVLFEPRYFLQQEILFRIFVLAPKIVLIEDTNWVKVTMVGWQPEDFMASLLDDVIHFVAGFFCCLSLCQEPKIFP